MYICDRLHIPFLRFRTPRGMGFTLIELLVVISIIALLMGILLPALESARRVARETVCATQMRSFAQASVAIANDRDGVLPDLSPDGQRVPYWWSGGWRDELVGNYSFQRENYYSPTNPAWNRDDFWGEEGDNWFVSGYFAFAGKDYSPDGMNITVNGTGPSPRRPLFPDTLEVNSHFTMIVADLNRIWPAGSGSFVTPGSDRNGANHLVERDDEPHGSHIGHVDGHVVFQPGSEVLHRYTANDSEIYW